MRSPHQTRTINKALALNGLGTLDEPRALLGQIAFLIRNEKQFRNLLLTCEPDKRREAYEALKPRITAFPVRPLEDYIIEGRMEAERLQLPEWDNETKQVREHGHQASQESAQRAILKAVRETEGKQVQIVCARCTRTAVFSAKDPVQSLKDAENLGWSFELSAAKETAPVEAACICRCGSRDAAEKAKEGETFERLDIVCHCCDLARCPKHFPEKQTRGKAYCPPCTLARMAR